MEIVDQFALQEHPKATGSLARFDGPGAYPLSIEGELVAEGMGSYGDIDTNDRLPVFEYARAYLVKLLERNRNKIQMTFKWTKLSQKLHQAGYGLAYSETFIEVNLPPSKDIVTFRVLWNNLLSVQLVPRPAPIGDQVENESE